jgi:hypothetical protein
VIVIADSSPLNYLMLIGEADLLYELYGRVLIPQAVLSELQHHRAPSVVAQWIEGRPAWLEVRRVANPSKESIKELDLGESEAIALAEEYKPDVLLLIDEETGRLRGEAPSYPHDRHPRHPGRRRCTRPRESSPRHRAPEKHEFPGRRQLIGVAHSPQPAKEEEVARA